MKKPVYLDADEWALVEGLLSVSTRRIAADTKEENEYRLSIDSQAALKWSNRQLARIRATIRKAAGILDQASPVAQPQKKAAT